MPLPDSAAGAIREPQLLPLGYGVVLEAHLLDEPFNPLQAREGHRGQSSKSIGLGERGVGISKRESPAAGGDLPGIARRPDGHGFRGRIARHRRYMPGAMKMKPPEPGYSM